VLVVVVIVFLLFVLVDDDAVITGRHDTTCAQSSLNVSDASDSLADDSSASIAIGESAMKSIVLADVTCESAVSCSLDEADDDDDDDEHESSVPLDVAESEAELANSWPQKVDSNCIVSDQVSISTHIEPMCFDWSIIVCCGYQMVTYISCSHRCIARSMRVDFPIHAIEVIGTHLIASSISLSCRLCGST
jgi:hypothetical protein